MAQGTHIGVLDQPEGCDGREIKEGGDIRISVVESC